MNDSDFSYFKNNSTLDHGRHFFLSSSLIILEKIQEIFSGEANASFVLVYIIYISISNFLFPVFIAALLCTLFIIGVAFYN